MLSLSKHEPACAELVSVAKHELVSEVKHLMNFRHTTFRQAQCDKARTTVSC
jgi:hypothetical protein